MRLKLSFAPSAIRQPTKRLAELTSAHHEVNARLEAVTTHPPPPLNRQRSSVPRVSRARGSRRRQTERARSGAVNYTLASSRPNSNAAGSWLRPLGRTERRLRKSLGRTSRERGGALAATTTDQRPPPICWFEPRAASPSIRVEALRALLRPMSVQRALVEASGLFDSAHYVAQCPDAIAAPLAHFLTNGRRNLRLASPSV